MPRSAGEELEICQDLLAELKRIHLDVNIILATGTAKTCVLRPWKTSRRASLHANGRMFRHR
jgi:hypothetical protein